MNDNNSKETWFVLAYILCLCVEPIKELLNIIGVPSSMSSILTLVMVYIPMLIGIIKHSKISLDFVIIIVFVFCAFGLTLLIFPEYKTVILSKEYNYSAISQILAPFGSIFMFLFVRNIKNPNNAVKPFIIAMIVIFLYYTFLAIDSNGIWKIGETERVSVYNMSFSYGILLPVLTFFTWGIKKKKILPILFALIGVFEILVYGSRGALAVVMCYFVLYLFWGWRPKKQYVKGLVLFTIIFGTIILMFSSEILLLLLDKFYLLLQANGYSSRTLRTIIYATSRTEDRFTEIWPNVMELIFNNYGLGCGVYADHYYLGGFCHNFILEIILDFGIILGGFILFYIAKELVFILKRCKDDVWQSYFLIIIPFWFMRLMFSSSFWYEGTFWTFLAATRCYRKYIRSRNFIN